MFMFKVAFSSFSNISQSACRTLYRVLNSQSDVDRALYISTIVNFVHQKIIPTLTCPGGFCDDLKYKKCAYIFFLICSVSGLYIAYLLSNNYNIHCLDYFNCLLFLFFFYDFLNSQFQILLQYVIYYLLSLISIIQFYYDNHKHLVIVL